MSWRLAKMSCTLTAWAAVGLLTTAPAAAQYPAENVSLYSRVSPAQFNANRATDCWGYVSASGREYAIIGLSTGTGFVDITDPENPVIVGHVRHPGGGWDVKVYQHYVYSGTDGGPLHIIDVGDIDNGVITLVNTLSRGAHNIAVDELSGYLYLARGGMTVLDLADPVANWQDSKVLRDTLGRTAGAVGWYKQLHLGEQLGAVLARHLLATRMTNTAAVIETLREWLHRD